MNSPGGAAPFAQPPNASTNMESWGITSGPIGDFLNPDASQSVLDL